MADFPQNSADLAAHLLRTNPRLRRLSKKVTRQQERLRQVLTTDGMRAYAGLEEATHEHLRELVDLVWTEACSQIRRSKLAAVDDTGHRP